MNESDLVAVTSRSFSKNEKLIKELQSKYKKIKLNYKIALIQRKNIYNNVGKNIQEYKKAKAIMVLKSQYIGSIINRVQISIIFVSSTITLFESIKSNFIIDKNNIKIKPTIIIIKFFRG